MYASRHCLFVVCRTLPRKNESTQITMADMYPGHGQTRHYWYNHVSCITGIVM